MCTGFSHVRLFATLWTVSCQALLSMGFYGGQQNKACVSLQFWVSWLEIICKLPGTSHWPSSEQHSAEISRNTHAPENTAFLTYQEHSPLDFFMQNYSTAQLGEWFSDTLDECKAQRQPCPFLYTLVQRLTSPS